MSVVKVNGLITFIILIVFSKYNYAFRVFEYSGVETILALENENIAIQCKTNLPMSYCGFLHPSGRRYSFTDLAASNGNCIIKINITKADVGEWKCHIGMKAMRVEMLKVIELRVVDNMAAVQDNVTALHGEPVTLACATTKGMVPLSYCRFEPPHSTPFSIDSTVSISNPILNRYYFPPNKSLDRGDCAVTIRKVKYEDLGIWTCGAALDDGQEYTDRIKLEVEGFYTMSTASATGVTVGAVLIVVTLVILGYYAWKRRWFLGSHRQEEGEVIEVQELGQQRIPQNSPHGSPQVRRAVIVPSVVIQSPSEPSNSPAST
ncbi:unnamed protein product [Parnassius apollo]|uniref:(apollo) hypothetical protein n=1 Tax=Parnassius apollo TaxID=110799 RepID=A0A8S3X8R4_PARAO|nr:unnamed protein product [Parnassius apollo]